MEMSEHITLVERLNETNVPIKTMPNEQIDDSLQHFSEQQKKNIKAIIEKRYDMLKNLSK